MNITDFEAVLHKCQIDIKDKVTLQSTLGEIGMDSLDVMMVTFEINSMIGNKIEIHLNNSVSDVLDMANGK